MMADDSCYELLSDGQPTGRRGNPRRLGARRCGLSAVQPRSADAALDPARSRLRHLPARIRRRLRRRRPVPTGHAPLRHRLPLTHLDSRPADRPCQVRGVRSGFPPTPILPPGWSTPTPTKDRPHDRLFPPRPRSQPDRRPVGRRRQRRPDRRHQSRPTAASSPAYPMPARPRRAAPSTPPTRPFRLGRPCP